MKNRFKSDNIIKCINSGESYMSEMIIVDKSIKINFINLFIMPCAFELPASMNSRYIDFCTVIFHNVNSLVFENIEIDSFKTLKGECFGGQNFFDDNFYEFWIDCKECELIIDGNLNVSKIPFDKKKILKRKNLFSNN